MSGRHEPAARDQQESPFSDILARFWRANGSVLSAAFVDSEGECIDYYSSLDPYDAKVAGAQMVALMAILRDACERTGMGQSRVWTVEATHRDLVIARVTDEYYVVLVLQPRGLTARLLEALDGLIEAFRHEAGLGKAGAAVAVELGDDGHPSTVVLPSGRVRVARVLARWSESGAVSTEPRRCYRVLVEPEDAVSGVPPELTLVHDLHLGSYRVRGWRPSR